MPAIGTVTVSRRTTFSARSTHEFIRKYSLAWVSDSLGAVSGTLTEVISGVIVKAVFIPDSGGTQPTNLYDVTLLDENGLDVLAGRGANLSNSASSATAPGLAVTDGTTTGIVPVPIDDQLELRVANGGNAKGGSVVLYVR